MAQIRESNSQVRISTFPPHLLVDEVELAPELEDGLVVGGPCLQH